MYSGPSDFCHLHSHSIYSYLDGCCTIEQYANKCEKEKWQGMAITEHGHMGSVPDFYLEFTKRGLKPIFGCEIYFNDWEPERQRLEKQGTSVRKKEWRQENPELAARISRNRHLTVLCKNETGFQNLIKLTTQAYDTGLFGMGRTQYNRIWFDKLCEFKEGLIILSGCLNGPVAHELRYKQLTDREGNVIKERSQSEASDCAIEYVKKFKKEFGENYYIETQMPLIENDHRVFKQLVAIADRYKIKLVLANDSHYLTRKEFLIQKIMMAIAQETTIDSPDLFHVNSDEQFVKTRAELWDTFINNKYSSGIDNGVFESMCDNTLEIIDKCERIKIDVAPKIPEIESADTKLQRMVAFELKKRGLDKCKERFVIDGREVTYVDQAKIELNRFIEKGFSSYFLITSDLVKFGKSNGMMFSPRGSAGGSLVCFLLGISVINPCLWGLSFDRFLSPARGGYMLNVTVPD